MKKRIIGIVAILCLGVMIFAGCDNTKTHEFEEDIWEGAKSFDQTEIVTMEKEVGVDFKILQLTDTQINANSGLEYLTETIDKLVADQEPDLITITGDLVAGHKATDVIDSFIALIDGYDIPWAPVFGNHDINGNTDLNYFAKKLLESDNCLFKVGPTNIGGVGNYVINIVENDTPVYSLFMMDSHASIYNDNGATIGYDSLRTAQINWYIDNVKGIQGTKSSPVPSMAFFHIPLQEYETAFYLAKEGSADAEIISGQKGEEIYSGINNTGFFEAGRVNGLTHVVVGHDHINNYTVEYKGVYLTYGQKTGDWSYHDDAMNGGTLISVGTVDGVANIDMDIIQVDLETKCMGGDGCYQDVIYENKNS